MNCNPKKNSNTDIIEAQPAAIEGFKSLITIMTKMLQKLTNHIPQVDITSQPTTVIYQNVKGLSESLLATNGTAAIRIVQDEFCKKLIHAFGKAIVSTSANISGNNNPKQFSEISEEIKNNADYIVNLRQEQIMESSSTIIKINENETITKLR